MKPSERIKEIIQTIDLSESNPLLLAILKYLDEEWQKEQDKDLIDKLLGM